MLQQEEVFLMVRELRWLNDLKQQVVNPDCPYLKVVLQEIYLIEEALKTEVH